MVSGNFAVVEKTAHEADENSTAEAQRAPESFSSGRMRWIRQHHRRQVVLSGCGRYEIAGRYVDGSFAWRGREISTDRLICSSADQQLVKLTCERHAEKVEAEAV